MKRSLALAATCAAALASIATSQIEPTWEVGGTANGPALTMTSSGTLAHAIQVTAVSADVASGGVDGRAIVNANACLSGTATGPVTLLLAVTNDLGDGTAATREVPACPQTVTVTASALLYFDCPTDPCTRTANVSFRREGAAGGDVTIDWTADAFLSGAGDNPPPGAAVDVIIQ